MKKSLFLILFFGVFAILQSAPYTDDIGESEPGVVVFTNLLQNGNPLPEELKFFYSGVREEIYLAFYDRLGYEVYYRFRKDKWDDRPLKILDHLVSGQAYGMKGKFLGILIGTKYIPADDPALQGSLSDMDAKLLFDFESQRPLRLDQLLL